MSEKKTMVYGEGRLELELERGVMVATFCRPHVRNALDIETMMAFREIVDLLEKRPGVIALILAGRGPAFVSGGDLEQLAGLHGEVGGRALSELMGETLMRFESLPQITIASMDGDAYGGGVELALSCDLRIMERNAMLALTQAKFGLTTGWGGAMRLVRLIGYSKALDLLLNLRRLTAEEAEQLGLVNRVVDEGEGLAAARAMAHRIAGLGREVALGIKSVVQSAAKDSVEEAILCERGVFASLWGTENHTSQVAAFLSRKKR